MITLWRRASQHRATNQENAAFAFACACACACACAFAFAFAFAFGVSNRQTYLV